MEISWLYQMPIWVNGLLFVAVLFTAIEFGYRIGSRRYRAVGKATKKTGDDVTLASMLALLGLLLAFTYSFSLSRADMRKQAILNEANAIGTAFLRADLAQEPGRSALRQALLDYARTRVPGKGLYGDALRAETERSLQVQSRLWPATKQALQGELPAPIQALIVQAVNEVLDMHAARIAVIRDRLPGAVLLLLVLVAATSLAVAAHNAALNAHVNRGRMTAFAIALAALMLIIVDFDRGKEGLVQISDRPLLDLIRDLESDAVTQG